ncbi:N-carbamoyl-D-amino-acid hydrolase [Nocardioides sp.]|uniref:N-carbamoyl-D-amino-acid hydrolase n=1 Tax=Nocardioides sp. TaxID=35761 RepID=UPI00261F35A0|nr:N-carbamoyl-D-amino-acid hydrolase [Nocardioides sp.]MDI6908568.1 N-carbamoyl-D-amino-acid hydrolase [Nocardioides sp.]
MSKDLTLAVAQVGGISIDEDRTSVVTRLVALLREAKMLGADLVVFPELTLTAFFPRYHRDDVSDMDGYFERSMPSPPVQPLFDAAKELGIGFHLGYAELTPEGRHFNTAILVNANGEIVGKYRKIHLPGHAEPVPNSQFQHLEKRYFEVGDLGFGVFDAFGARIGMAICNDRRWPETYRMLSLQGAELGLFGYNTPTMNWNPDEESHLIMFNHLLALQAGAYQNAMWIAAAAKAGREDGHRLIGGSVIIAPSGEIVAKAHTEADEVIAAPIDLEFGRHFRDFMLNFAAHRRPEQYGLLLERTGYGDPLPVPRDRW